MTKKAAYLAIICILSTLTIISLSSKIVTSDVLILQNTTRPTLSIIPAVCGTEDSFETNTTYYFQGFIGGYGYELEAQGPASHELMVTTNDTHRCFNFSNKDNLCDSYPYLSYVKGVHFRMAPRSFKSWGDNTTYLPWSFINNDTGYGLGSYGDGYWSSRYGNPGAYRIPELRCDNPNNSFIIGEQELNVTSASDSSRYIGHPEIAIYKSERDILSTSFNVSKGKLQIYFNGTGNDWDDLVTALSDADPDTYTLSPDSLTFIGGFVSDDPNAELTISGKSITMISGSTDSSRYEVEGLTFNEGSQVTYDSWGSYRGHLGASYVNSKLLCTDASSNDLDSFGTVSNLNIYANSMTHYGSWDSLTFSGPGNVQQHQSRYFANGRTGYNGVYYNVYEYHSPSGSVSNLDSYAYFENLTFHNDEDFNTNFGDIYAYLGYVDDCLDNWNVYDMKNVFTDRPDSRPVHVYVPVIAENICDYDLNYTYHSDSVIRVISVAGTPVSGAVVNLTSDYFSYGGVTDVNGSVVFDVRNYVVYIDPDNCGGSGDVFPGKCANWLDQSRYNLSVSKSGYSRYESFVNILGPEDWTISLVDSSDSDSGIKGPIFISRSPFLWLW